MTNLCFSQLCDDANPLTPAKFELNGERAEGNRFEES